MKNDNSQQNDRKGAQAPDPMKSDLGRTDDASHMNAKGSSDTSSSSPMKGDKASDASK